MTLSFPALATAPGQQIARGTHERARVHRLIVTVTHVLRRCYEQACGAISRNEGSRDGMIRHALTAYCMWFCPAPGTYWEQRGS
jgi:hypothetical protein